MEQRHNEHIPAKAKLGGVPKVAEPRPSLLRANHNNEEG